MKRLVFTLMSMLVLTSCASDEAYVSAMANEIDACEARINEFCEEFPFEDTVAEGDEYQTMVEAKQMFDNASSVKQKEEAFDLYMKSYKRVVEDALDIKMRVLGEY